MKEWKTLNSMVPLWQRQKSKVKPEEYNAFYKEKFMDWQDPLAVIHTSAEGAVTYKAMLYIPQPRPPTTSTPGSTRRAAALLLRRAHHGQVRRPAA